MNDSISWYIRYSGSTAEGPFNSSTIKNQLAVGRLKINVEVSQDKIIWRSIAKQPEFHTAYTKQFSKQLDERNGFDRRQDATSDVPVQRADNDRRAVESHEDVQRRQARTRIMQQFLQQKKSFFIPVITMGIFSVIVLALAIVYSELLPFSQSNCDAQPAPNINWENCIKPKINLKNSDLNHAQLRNSQLTYANIMNSVLTNANLAYADLRFANLSYSQLQDASLLGANLQNSDLSYSDLSNSDLSYADLRHAILGASNLTNARFDHAIWVDGKKCAENSIGQCIKLMPIK